MCLVPSATVPRWLLPSMLTALLPSSSVVTASWRLPIRSAHSSVALAALDAADMVVTRIAAIKADDEDAVWFDMNGRQLQHAPSGKGVYIYNGKKYVIK